MAGHRLLNDRNVPRHPDAVRPPRAPGDLRAQAEGMLREVAYVLHLTRSVTADLTRPAAAVPAG